MIRPALLALAAVLPCALADAADDLTTICRPGYAREHRLPANEYYPLAQAVFAAHGIAWGERHNYELDHTRPLCLGGSNEISNLVPQPIAEARRKDDLERYACRAACAGEVPLAEAVSWFRDAEAWKPAYRHIFHKEP